MLLTRRGNKRRIANDIVKYFPRHNIYIEYFFGAGGIYFNKPPAKYNYLNDLDGEVINLFTVLLTKPDKLQNLLELMPFHQKLFKDIIKGFIIDSVEPGVWNAAKLVYLSNYSYLGAKDILQLSAANPKKISLTNLTDTVKFINANHNKFTCLDFRDILKNISFKTENEKKNTFIYADPPYLGTCGKQYGVASWVENDSMDLFANLTDSGIRFAISEFDNPFILDLASKYDLNIINITERCNLKNKQTEVLITNYKLDNELF
jgi:DNA adenine methylase